jgi:hypothetical protein
VDLAPKLELPLTVVLEAPARKNGGGFSTQSSTTRLPYRIASPSLAVQETAILLVKRVC